ncbi:MAG: glycine cleavage system protein GcvH [Alphaproteobacteria bacterium]|nr:glycine cleavage system protein GcvH [Alphaproteobacteria bacterium]
MIKFTDQHEWVRVEGEEAVVGITPYAAEQLGDVVFVELPEAGRKVDQFKEAAVVESVKAASEIYAPVGGEVVAVNAALAETPGLVNEDALGKGWFLKLRIRDKGELDKLMSAEEYETYVKGL